MTDATADRTPPPPLEELFKIASETPSDINEHLPLLRELASKCEHVTEMGLRGANGSTVAFLAAQPETFVSWDLNPWSVVNQSVANLLSLGVGPHGEWNGRVGRTRFQPRVGDTLQILIEPTDMLFIDTYHTFSQLKAELERHADPIERKVRKYLAFHDTETFGQRGEDGKSPGLRTALVWFQKNSFPLWGLKYDHSNNNGLIVLERMDVTDAPGIWPDAGRERFK